MSHPFSAATASPLTAPLPIAVSGNGVMGQLVRETLLADPQLDFAGCIGPGDLSSLQDLPPSVSGLIDFSHPDCLKDIIEYVTVQSASHHKIPLVIATTGYSKEQTEQIHQLANLVPVVFSSNFSPGVTILNRLLRELAPLLADWDLEIVEKHHSRKLDAPSGTALTLAASSGRQPKIHSLRGGDIPGVHEVFYMGSGENLTLKHEALDRRLFATGAIRAMKFALEQDRPGLWTMEDVIFRT